MCHYWNGFYLFLVLSCLPPICVFLQTKTAKNGQNSQNGQNQTKMAKKCTGVKMCSCACVLPQYLSFATFWGCSVMRNSWVILNYIFFFVHTCGWHMHVQVQKCVCVCVCMHKLQYLNTSDPPQNCMCATCMHCTCTSAETWFFSFCTCTCMAHACVGAKMSMYVCVQPQGAVQIWCHTNLRMSFIIKCHKMVNPPP